MSDGVEWGLHCLTVLATLPEGTALSGRSLAEFHGVSETYLLKHLKALTRAKLLVSMPGAKGGYRLARSARAISYLDVVAAIDGKQPAFRCKEIRRCGPAASNDPWDYRLPCAIHAVMARAERAWQEQLCGVTLADTLGQLGEQLPASKKERVAAWLDARIRPA